MTTAFDGPAEAETGVESAPDEAVRRRRSRGSQEPVDQFNIRASVADINRFITWCETNRYSYREGFGRLVSSLENSS